MIIPLGILILAIFAPWEFFTFVSKRFNSTKSAIGISRFRWKLLKYVGWAFVDWGCIFLSIFILITLYRIPSLIMMINDGFKRPRTAIGLSFLCIWMDLFCFFLFIPQLISIYRLYTLYQRGKGKKCAYKIDEHGVPSDPELQVVIMKNFASLIK